MYEAVRERAPASTQIAGASATVLALVLAGYALTSGLGVKMAKAFAPPVTLITVEKIADTPPVKDPVFDDASPSTLAIPEPLAPSRHFETDEGPTVIGKTEPVATGPIGPVNVAPPVAKVRVSPKLATREKPDYPPPSVRAHEEGLTGLDLCVDARGRVTAASLASSSGYRRLDEAALKWVKTARFAPGTVDGAAQAMCGHQIVYEWTLANGTSRD